MVIKDHPEFSGQALGNDRLFLCDKNGNGRIELKGEDTNDPDYTEIIQESHYYPFGLEMQGPWNPTQWEPGNAYRYNGKELNSDLGLVWYDYGARWYDAGIARWGAVDPLADNYYEHSGYSYAGNNPVINYDPNGEFIATIIGAIAGGVINAIRGENIWKGVASGATAGAVIDLTVASGGTVGAIVLAGAASGAAANIVDQTWDIAAGDQQKFQTGELAISAALGGALAGLGSWGGKMLQGAFRKTTFELGETSFSVIDDNVDDALRLSSKYENVTTKRSSVRNIATDVEKDEFIANVKKSGYRVIREDEKVTILQKENGGRTYTVRKDKNGGFSADLREKPGQKKPNLKIRLGRKD